MKTSSPMTIKKMSPQLFTADIGRSIAFYTENLGFVIDFRYEDFYAGIIKDGCSIHLKLTEIIPEERENRLAGQHPHIVFLIGDIEALYVHLKDKPVKIIQPLRDIPYGREFYIVDPDGNVMAFLQE